jgi:hypothetical protein
MKRTERPGGPKPDGCYAKGSNVCYAIRSSVLDSDDESEPDVTNAIGSLQGTWEGLSTALLYEGDPITLSQGAGA